MIVIQITYWSVVLCALVLQSTKDSTHVSAAIGQDSLR